MGVVKALLEACDQPPRHGRRIMAVEMDGNTYTVAIDHSNRKAMIVRGSP